MKFFHNVVLSVAILLTAASGLVLSKRVDNLKHELTLLTTELENKLKKLDVKLETAKGSLKINQ